MSTAALTAFFLPDCRGAGGCWTHRPELRVRLLPISAWPDGPPF
ncbi:hypothetical protein ACFY4K_33440 [Streptomyces leeuwenhoekii]